MRGGGTTHSVAGCSGVPCAVPCLCARATVGACGDGVCVGGAGPGGFVPPRRTATAHAKNTPVSDTRNNSHTGATRTLQGTGRLHMRRLHMVLQRGGTGENHNTEQQQQNKKQKKRFTATQTPRLTIARALPVGGPGARAPPRTQPWARRDGPQLVTAVADFAQLRGEVGAGTVGPGKPKKAPAPAGVAQPPAAARRHDAGAVFSHPAVVPKLAVAVLQRQRHPGRRPR